MQLGKIATWGEDWDLNDIWALWFDTPRGDSRDPHELVTFEERREGFLWTLKQLFEHGYIELNRPGGVPYPGSIDEKLQALREAFRSNDDDMEDGLWFLFPECPMGSNWKWPSRSDPLPFVADGTQSSLQLVHDPLRRRLAAPGIDRVERGSAEVLAPEHVDYIATAVRGLGLAEVWAYFLEPNGYPEVPHWCESYEERIEGFAWVVQALVEGGYARLRRRKAGRAGGDLDDLIRELRERMPDDEQDLDDGGFFFYRECSVVIRWDVRPQSVSSRKN